MRVWSAVGVQEICQGQEEEGQHEGEEQQTEGHCRAQRQDPEQEGEDEPAKEVEGERVQEGIGALGFEGFHDFKSTGCQNNRGPDPETSVGRKSS